MEEDATEDLMVVMVTCAHRFGQPYTRLCTEPRHTLRVPFRCLREAGGGPW
jgi:hypothetical protein